MRYRSAVLGAATALALVAGQGLAGAAGGDPLERFYGQAVDWQECQDPVLPEPPEGGIIIDPWAGLWHLMDCAW